MDERDELDSRRISQLAGLRRGAYRSRSYCIIAAIACVVGAIEMVFESVRHFIAGSGLILATLYLPGSLAILALGFYFVKLARRFHAEAKRSHLESPPNPPDLSSLSDGSQLRKNLEELQ